MVGGEVQRDEGLCSCSSLGLFQGGFATKPGGWRWRKGWRAQPPSFPAPPALCSLISTFATSMGESWSVGHMEKDLFASVSLLAMAMVGGPHPGALPPSRGRHVLFRKPWGRGSPFSFPLGGRR